MNNHFTPLKKTLPLSLFAATVLLSGQASATLLSSDLSISASIELLDTTTVFSSPNSDGQVTQSGEIRVISGGTPDANSFSTSSGGVGSFDGSDDGTTIFPSSNPTTGNLTHTGDGIAYSADLTNTFDNPYDFFSYNYNYNLDYGISLNNTSLTDTFTITFSLDSNNRVDSDSLDGFSDSTVDIEIDNVDQFKSAVKSDSLLGDRRNGTNLGTFGDVVQDNQVQTFNITLNPGDLVNVTGQHAWNGGVYDPGTTSALLSLSLLISDVSCSGSCGSTPPPSGNAPVPGTLALLALGLIPAVASARRRRA